MLSGLSGDIVTLTNQNERLRGSSGSDSVRLVGMGDGALTEGLSDEVVELHMRAVRPLVDHSRMRWKN
eukprot:SAG11_NODE_3344_length_2509_cov_4.892946_3_plen_68_part_00